MRLSYPSVAGKLFPWNSGWAKTAIGKQGDRLAATMSPGAVTAPAPPLKLDYSLTGVNSTLAVERGLAEAEWYQCQVPRDTMRSLLQRRDGPAIRDTILWFALIFASGYQGAGSRASGCQGKDRLHPRGLPATRHSGVRHDPLSRVRYSGAFR